jgi:hypothetical protein
MRVAFIPLLAAVPLLFSGCGKRNGPFVTLRADASPDGGTGHCPPQRGDVGSKGEGEGAHAPGGGVNSGNDAKSYCMITVAIHSRTGRKKRFGIS